MPFGQPTINAFYNIPIGMYAPKARGVFWLSSFKKLTAAGNCGAAFGADTLSPITNVSWKNILSKTKNQHHNCLLLQAALSQFHSVNCPILFFPFVNFLSTLTIMILTTARPCVNCLSTVCFARCF